MIFNEKKLSSNQVETICRAVIELIAKEQAGDPTANVRELVTLILDVFKAECYGIVEELNKNLLE